MKTMEERLWDYIDGFSTGDEKISIEKLLQTDPSVKSLYEKLLSLNLHLKAMEVDEPSMRFTQNVMDRIVSEPAPRMLQTKVDLRIIRSIGAFFIGTLSILVVIALTQINWSWNLPIELPATDINWTKYFNGTFVQVFAVVFIILALVTIDRVLQYRKYLHLSSKA